MILKTQNLAFGDFIFYKDIQILENKVNFLTGASGIGKTTLFKLINKTANKSSGQIYYKDQNIDEVDPKILRSEIMLLSQTPYLFDGTIHQNFDLFYSYLEKTVLDDDEISAYLTLVAIDFDLSKDCTMLSGGEKHRVFIAIHLSLMPKIILLDEPTSSLDQKTSALVIENIVAFTKQNGITLVIISHNNEIVEKFSQNTIVL